MRKRAVGLIVAVAAGCTAVPPSTSVDLGEVDRAIHDPRMICIRRHESDRDGAPLHLGGLMAKNARSTASGMYQWLNRSWSSAARSHGFPEWASVPARFAPADVQHVVTLRVVDQGGMSNWAGSGC